MATSRIELELQAHDFEKGDRIGVGLGGKVFKAEWKSQKMPVAMKKVIHIDNVEEGRKVSCELGREVEILSQLHHPNIIRFYGIVVLSDVCYMVTELAERKSLWDFFQHNPNPEGPRSFRWAKEIAAGVQYLHQQKCLHRNLKSSNVLLKEDLTAKICDFTKAKLTENLFAGTYTVQTNHAGSFQWLAPEAIKGEAQTEVSDVYSYGILLWELLTHKVPFEHLRLQIPGQEFQLQVNITSGERPPIPDSCGPKLASLIQRCWDQEPTKRPTITEVLFELEQGVELPAQDFEKGVRIGRESGGIVFKAQWKSRKMPVAMKRIIDVDNDEEGPKIGRKIGREVEILSKLRNSNVIRCYGTVILNRVYYMVTEFAEKGSLWDFFRNNPDPDLSRNMCWAKEIAAGVQYLHQQKCLHRDLRSGNVLLKEDLTAKICDFGEAKLTENLLAGTIHQTYRKAFYEWLAPEAIKGDPQLKVSSSLDVYAYGILLWELLTHKVPFEHLGLTLPGQAFQLQMAITKGERPPIPDGCGITLASLMQRCWKNEPVRRPTMAEVLPELERVILGIEAMTFGYVEAQMIVLLLIGAVGAGKTSAKHLLLGLNPPSGHQSAPLAEEALHAIYSLQALVSDSGTTVLGPITLERLKQMTDEAIKALQLQATCLEEQQSGVVPPSSSSASNESTAPHCDDIEEPSCGDDTKSKKALPEVEPSISSSPRPKKLLNVAWVTPIDICGGQPSLYEILPLFVRAVSAVALIVNLSERLSDRPTMEADGKGGKKEHSSPLMNRNLLHHSIQEIHSRQSFLDKVCPQLIVVGTHKDLEHKCSESRTEKDNELLEMLQPHFKGNVVDCRPEELIFALNAKTPADEDENIAELFRERVISGRSSVRVKIPLPWFQLIQQLAAKLQRKVLHTSECKEEAVKLHMDAEKCEAALVLLDEVNMLFYRPKHLPGLVFGGSQVLLDKISELAELWHRLQGESEANSASPGHSDPISSTSQSPELGSSVTPAAAHEHSQGSWWPSRLLSYLRPSSQPPTQAGSSMSTTGSSVEGNSISPSSQDSTQTQASDVSLLGTSVDLPVQAPDFNATTLQGAFPDISEFSEAERIKLRDHSIFTVSILRKFSKHYVKGLFTAEELLKLLTAFLIVAPVRKGSPEYVMPCLLQDLDLKELRKHRQSDPASAVAPLLIQFPDDSVPTGVFTILIAYLRTVANWKLYLSDSCNPCCLHHNCVQFHVPTGHGGYVTIIKSLEYLEIHAAIDGLEDSQASQTICSQITADVVHGIDEVSYRLQYGVIELKKAFFCPCQCQGNPHPANPLDDKLICSRCCKTCIGELKDCHKLWPSLKETRTNCIQAVTDEGSKDLNESDSLPFFAGAGGTTGGDNEDTDKAPEIKKRHSLTEASAESELQLQDFDEQRELIGKGTFGEVFKGTWRSMLVAMKKPYRTSDKDEITREVTMLSKLHHHNIIVYHGTVTLSDSYYIVTELAENGSLWDYLHNSKTSSVPDPSQSLCWAKGIAAGIQYLHQQKPSIIHRDLKSPNILLKEDLTAKISDFGSAKFMHSSVVGTPQSAIRGTYQWMSPEAIRWKGNKVSAASDLYSYGIIVYELFTHKVPFNHIEDYELRSKIVQGERPQIPDGVNPKLTSLMQWCWKEDPESRPKLSDIFTKLTEIGSTVGAGQPKVVGGNGVTEPDNGIHSSPPPSGDSGETAEQQEEPTQPATQKETLSPEAAAILAAKPKAHELEDLGSPPIDIIACVQGKWRKLISQFKLPPHTTFALQSKSPEDACRDVFTMWLAGGDELRSPKAWSTVIEVLENVGHGDLAKEVKAILMKQKR